jgi:hypothetical protein
VKVPRAHPALQHFNGERKHAKEDGRPISYWGNVKFSSIEGSCREIAERHPDWHPDMTALDLSAYNIHPQKVWWLPATQGGENGT